MLTPLQDFDRLWQSTYAAARGNMWDPVTNPKGSKIARYASTAMVARDLVELAERHGQWREKEARIKGTDQKTLHRLRWRRGGEPLLVSMASYGTLLGSTLAAMQPHRVHRFYLDGVVDAAEYYAGELNIDADDSDAVVEKFFEYCALAGPGLCPMWAGNASTATRRRLEDIYADIRLNGPIAVPGSNDVDPDIIFGAQSGWPRHRSTTTFTAHSTGHHHSSRTSAFSSTRTRQNYPNGTPTSR